MLDTGRFIVYDSTGDKMKSIVEQTMLYDFYGELLTPHQRQVYEDIVFHDMSLGEVAQERGISRQGVHDLVKRCDKILSEYEEKLRLVEKFRKTRFMVEQIKDLTGRYRSGRDESLLLQIERIAEEIMDI